MEKLWQESSDDVRETYGRDYFDAYLRSPGFARETDISPVLDAMEDAVLSRQPREQYSMGDGAWLLPALKLLYPAAINREKTLRKYTFYTGATPESLKFNAESIRKKDK